MWQGLTSVPQTALNNRSFAVPLGRAVGGSSIINAMIFFRSAAEDYNTWASLGAAGLGWNSLLPYFKKSESFGKPNPAFATQANISWVDNLHGTNGPLHVSYPNFFYPGKRDWWTAALQTGLQAIGDINGGVLRGISWITTTVDRASQTRSDARTAHYDRVADRRPNYHILPSTMVTKIRFSGTKAVGVEYVPTDGGSGGGSVLASKEVLLAAGALHTPQLLQLSGIGPQNLLNSLGIPVKVSLPGVGANFQDHPSVPILYSYVNQVFPNGDSLNANATYDAEQRALYDASRQSAYVLTRGFGTDVALLSLCDVTADCGQAILTAAQAADPAAHLPPGTDPTVLEGYQAQRAATLAQMAGNNTPVAMVHWTTGSAAIVFLLKPLSRGTVAVSSTDPLANPAIDWRALTDPIDLDVSVAGLLRNRQIMLAPAMSSGTGSLGPSEAAPFGNAVTDPAVLRGVLPAAMAPTSGHYCCTAAMLPRNQGGVVDSAWRVYGVQRLRVIDASYWPNLIAAVPMATMYGVSEKIADVIKTAYNL